MKVGRIVMIVIGALLALIGFGMLDRRDVRWSATPPQRTDGFFQTGEVRLASATYTITSDSVDLESEPGGSDWLIDRGALGTVRLSIDPGVRTRRYSLGSVPVPTSRRTSKMSVTTVIRDSSCPRPGHLPPVDGGGTPAAAPRSVLLGGPSNHRPGRRADMGGGEGDWTVVVMNADATRGVDLDARLGIKVDWLLPAVIGLMVAGLDSFGWRHALVIVGSRGLTRQAESAARRHRRAGRLRAAHR